MSLNDGQQSATLNVNLDTSDTEDGKLDQNELNLYYRRMREEGLMDEHSVWTATAIREAIK